MTERDEYTPTTEDIRENWADGWAEGYAQFHRWLAAHDEAVRQEEREKAAQIADVAALHTPDWSTGWRALTGDEVRTQIAAEIRAQGKERGR